MVLQNYGFEPKTCSIAHCKELNDLPVGSAPNRLGEDRGGAHPTSNRRSRVLAVGCSSLKIAS
jgi:hypothetical protein